MIAISCMQSQQLPPDIHSEEFLHLLMRRQLRLSIACAAAFLLALFALPLANFLAPELMSTHFFGFTLTWFILGIAFFPTVWAIAWFFIRRSIRLEEEEVRSSRQPEAVRQSAQVVEPPPLARAATNQ